MAATLVAKTASVSLDLENGRDTSGNMKYVSMSMGRMNADYITDSQTQAAAINSINAVATALLPCLSKNIGYKNLKLGYVIQGA